MDYLKIKKLKILVIIAILIASAVLLFSIKQQPVHAQENYVSPLNQITLLSSSGDDIGEYVSNIENDLSDVWYISNKAYFKANPAHAEQNHSYNVAGTCTTVAMQMLLGYHNYYSDRRLIPKYGENNRQFLSDDYGDLMTNPMFRTDAYPDYGLKSIGTKDGLYDELYDLTELGWFPGLGQAVGPVTRAAKAFVEKYSDIVDEVTIHTDVFSEILALSEIIEGRPIILGMSMLLNGAENYHMMLAYGYAELNGEHGFIVHYGYKGDEACMWVPSKYFQYQIYMDVQHTHKLIDTGENIETFEYNTVNYRKLECTECGYTTVDDLYETDESGHTITAVRYPVSGELRIPSKIHDKTPYYIGNGVFAGNDITSLQLTHYISEIGDSAFENCETLTTVSSFSWIDSIGKYAFRGCDLNMRIELPCRISKIGYGAFAGCDRARISVDESNARFCADDNILYNKSKTTIIQAFSVDNTVTIPFFTDKIVPYAFEKNRNIDTVIFTGNPEIGDSAFANCINLGTVYFDTYSAPVVGTDVFQNYVPTIVVPYNAQDDFKQAFSQYSYAITSSQFAIDFISNGQVIESRTVYNGSTIESLPIPTMPGYDFGGWYDNKDYNGKPYSEGGLWESNDTITLYAKWIPQDCTVIFDGNGGIISGDNFVIVKYGSSLPVSVIAEKEGHVLDGWYDSDNEKYFTADGRSTKAWDKVGITTLKAKWSPKSYEIKINNNGSITWLSNSGLSDDKCYIQYGTVLSSINLIALFKRSAQGFKEGKIFDHFEYENSTVDWTSVPDLGENYSVINIVPVWINEVHSIYFNPLCDMTVNLIAADYDSNISLPNPSRTGYVFNGWYTARTGGTKITWKTMPDLTPTDQNNGATQLFARWIAITYYIYYNANGGSGTMAYTTHTYDISATLRKNTFTKTEYNFIGWAKSATGSVVYTDGQSVINLAKTPSVSITLYAKWKAKTYIITYKNLASDMEVLEPYCYYEYGKGISVLPKPRFCTSYGQGPEIYNFYGWYTTIEFTTQVTSISSTQTGNIILYAKYDYYLTATTEFGPYTITDAGKDKNRKISFDTCMSVYYPFVENTTLNKIRIEFSLSLWEVNDGYQHIYFRDDTKNKIIWSKKLDHGGNKTNTSIKEYSFTIVLDLEQYKDTKSFTFLFDASGFGADNWKFECFSAYIYLTN